MEWIPYRIYGSPAYSLDQEYRKPVLQNEVAHKVRDIIREICAHENVDIMKRHVTKDHVHILLSIPPQVTINRLVLGEK